MWTKSESVICALGAFDLYWHIFEMTYSSTASTDCWFWRFTRLKVTATVHSPPGPNMFSRRESEHTPAEKTERQRSKINLPILTKAFNTRFQRTLAPNHGGNIFALTTVSIFLKPHWTLCCMSKSQWQTEARYPTTLAYIKGMPTNTLLTTVFILTCYS